jgi:hypothetical protein
MTLNRRRLTQAAYRIQAASSVQALKSNGVGGSLMLDTGWVASSAIAGIPYSGAALSSRLRVAWRVQVYLRRGRQHHFVLVPVVRDPIVIFYRYK